jgi:type IV secretion system protein VirB10
MNNLLSQPPIPGGPNSGAPPQLLPMPANDPPPHGPAQPDPLAQGAGAAPDPPQQSPSYNPLLGLAPQQPQEPAASARKSTTELNQASGKNYVIFEGTVLESALVNRLNGDFSGPVICMLTNDLYSHDHSRVLIPAGTKILGESKKVDSFGQTRLAVSFHRLIMPDGYSVDLDQFPGLNQIGETALKDKVNNHYIKIFGTSIAIGAIAGLATIGTNTAGIGVPVSSSDAYRQGVAGSLSQSSMQILDKFLNQLPTITIREGHRVKVYLMQDLKVPDYQHHQMSPDL